MNASDKRSRLKASKLFASLDDALLGQLAAEAGTRQYTAGEALWRAGDAAEHFTVIQRGLVQIVRLVSGGEATMLGLFGPRESIGDAAVMERGAYPADAIAAGEVEVLRVPAAPVLEALATNPAVAQALNKSLLEHTRALRAKIDVMSAGAVPQRLATLFLHLAERFGDEDEGGVLRIPVALARAEIARLVGARVETVIRTLSRWQKGGLLRTSSEGFELLDPEGMARAARGED